MPARRKHRQPKQEVTVTQMPHVTCSQCGRQLFFQPGKQKAADVLTRHVEDEHQ